MGPLWLRRVDPEEEMGVPYDPRHRIKNLSANLVDRAKLAFSSLFMTPAYATV